VQQQGGGAGFPDHLQRRAIYILRAPSLHSW